MEKSTVIGLAIGTVAIIMSILLGGSLLGFVDAPSFAVVIGGTIATFFTDFSMPEVKSIPKILGIAMKPETSPMKETIDQLVDMSEKARREGILAIEKVINEITDPFMKGGLRLAVDGSEPEAIEESMATEMENIEKRHKQNHAILEAAGTFAPAYGMIGTLIGLVNMLANMSDPASIGPAMAVALLTTLYGAIIANVVFLPIKGKLEGRTTNELTQKELIIAGVIGIQGGDNPRMLKAKLETYLPPSERSEEES